MDFYGFDVIASDDVPPDTVFVVAPPVEDDEDPQVVKIVGLEET